MFRHVLCEARTQAPKTAEHQTGSIIDCLRYLDNNRFQTCCHDSPPRWNFWVEKDGMSGTKWRIVALFYNACGVSFVFPITGTFKAVDGSWQNSAWKLWISEVAAILAPFNVQRIFQSQTFSPIQKSTPCFACTPCAELTVHQLTNYILNLKIMWQKKYQRRDHHMTAKVKLTLEQVMKEQRESRDIALHFL